MNFQLFIEVPPVIITHCYYKLLIGKYLLLFTCDGTDEKIGRALDLLEQIW